MNVPLETTHEVWSGYEANGYVVMSRDITYRPRAGQPDTLTRAQAYRDSLGSERRNHSAIVEVSRKVVG